MNHIKILEDFYLELTQQEHDFSKSHGHAMSNFTNYEINILNKLFDVKQLVNSSTLNVKLTRGLNLRIIQITKLEDEWFHISDSFEASISFIRHFKCDGIDGVIKFFEENTWDYKNV